MNLEDIEQKALAYLGQAGNPLVRIDVLFDHLEREVDMGGFSRSDLTKFLEGHDLIRVLSPVAAGDVEGRMLGEAGLLVEPSAIMRTRMPTRQQIAAAMVDQLDRLGEALVAALQEARAEHDEPTESQVRGALERATALRTRIVALHEAESHNPVNSAG